jgi:hypothetical protein
MMHSLVDSMVITGMPLIMCFMEQKRQVLLVHCLNQCKMGTNRKAILTHRKRQMVAYL